MGSVPPLDKVKFDLSGNMHLVCLEDGAIQNILNQLDNLELNLNCVRFLQLGTKKIEREALDIKQFHSIEDLQTGLIKILDRAKMGMRFYAIGSEQFVWNLRGCARGFGLSEEEINLEVISKDCKNIYCSNCQSINTLVKDNIFICDNCGIKLEVLNHFSRLKNSYLGICADAESLKEPSIK